MYWLRLKIDRKEIKVHTLKEAFNDSVFPSKRFLVVWIACCEHFYYIHDKFFVPRDPLCAS